MAINKKIDVSKKAKPTGLRFKGSHKKLGSLYYKRPEKVLSEKELKKYEHKGLVYYEPRLNKGDASYSKKFEFGGILQSELNNWLNEKISWSDFGL